MKNFMSNKYIKLILLNAGIAATAITVYSPGLLALYPTDISIFKAGMSIISGIGLLSAFGIGNMKILSPPQKKITLTTDIKDMTQGKEILNSYIDSPFFGETAKTILSQIDRLSTSTTKVNHEIERKFQKGSMSFNKFISSVEVANNTAFDNIIATIHRMQFFNEEEFKQLQNYKNDNIPDDIQEKQIGLYEENMNLIKQAIAVNENLILSLNSLGIELAKPGELNDDDILNEIQELTKEVKYYT